MVKYAYFFILKFVYFYFYVIVDIFCSILYTQLIANVNPKCYSILTEQNSPRSLVLSQKYS